MSRLARQLLFAAIIAYHAIVTVCGPCLHELPGASHETSAAAKANRPSSPVAPRSDTNDHCLICQFVAQGQLPVEFAYNFSTFAIADLAIPDLPVSEVAAPALPSCPRAPPCVSITLS